MRDAAWHRVASVVIGMPPVSYQRTTVKSPLALLLLTRTDRPR
jgi:hypothetical protein